jgi:hypothetical protein
MICATRRHFLATNAMGIGSLALAWLLKQDQLLAAPERPELAPTQYDLKPKKPHFEPRARAMISLFMQGGPSHIDLLEPKPVMKRYDGQPYPHEIKLDGGKPPVLAVFASPWQFHKHGQSGLEVSELLPHLGETVDDITIIRSLRTGVNNHGQSVNAMNTGRLAPGRPVLGSWVTYALGSENQNMPAYMVLTDPASLPVGGVGNFSNGWLPSLFQGTAVRAQEPRILNLQPQPHMRGAAQERYLSYLKQLNKEHAESRPGDLDLEARIASYELAARMQTSAREALDLSKETAATQRLYGIDDPATRDFGSRCLIARRLVERGVRFVQVFTRNQFWDSHGRIFTGLPAACRYVDKPSAALVCDLRSRGLLDSTIVSWGGEMGRMPVVQGEGGRDRAGRDHNTFGFSMWVAGGGFKGGLAYGATDDFGHHAVTDVVNHFDYHATLLHLFGLDHRRVVYRRNNLEQTLTDGQTSRVVHEILAQRAGP